MQFDSIYYEKTVEGLHEAVFVHDKRVVARISFPSEFLAMEYIDLKRMKKDIADRKAEAKAAGSGPGETTTLGDSLPSVPLMPTETEPEVEIEAEAEPEARPVPPAPAATVVAPPVEDTPKAAPAPAAKPAHKPPPRPPQKPPQKHVAAPPPKETAPEPTPAADAPAAPEPVNAGK